MRDLIIVSWLLAPWRWWRSLGDQLHEDVLTFCVFLMFASVLLYPSRWMWLLAWAWGEQGLGGSKEQLLTLGTGALAIVTFGLFARTADMAAATAQMAITAGADSIRSDRQHQQNLSGLLAINNLMLGVEPAIGDPQPGQVWEPGLPGSFLQQLVVLSGNVRNLGLGPALSARVSVTLKDVPIALPGFDVAPFSIPLMAELGAWAPGDSSAIGNGPGKLDTSWTLYKLNRPLTVADMQKAEIVLTWQTVVTGRGSVVFNFDSSSGRFISTTRLPEYVPTP